MGSTDSGDPNVAQQEGTRFSVLAPQVRGRKGEYRKQMDTLRRDGYPRLLDPPRTKRQTASVSIIEKSIELEGPKGTVTVTALFDSGASVSCIDRDLAEHLGTPVSLPRPRRFGTAEEGREVVVTDSLHLDFRFKGLDLFDDFFVVAGLAERVIVGAKTLQAWRMKLDFEQDDVVVDPRVARLRLVGLRPR